MLADFPRNQLINECAKNKNEKGKNRKDGIS